MSRCLPALLLAPVLVLSVAPARLASQATRHVHEPESRPGGRGDRGATLAGQDAFAAIAEVVRLLEADPATDWSKVDLERLRQHLIDMNAVTLGTEVRQRPVEGGAAFDLTGTGRTLEALRRMVHAHVAQFAAGGPYRLAATDLATGVRLTVIAADPADPRQVLKIRGLSFIGLLTLDDHHTAHHLMLARGGTPSGH